MANFYGTSGFDQFFGPNEINDFYFEAGEYAPADIVFGGTGGAADSIHFLDAELSGASGINIFAATFNIEFLYFDEGSNVIIPDSLVATAQGTAFYALIAHCSDAVDIIDASAVTTARPIWLNGRGGADEFHGGGEDSLYSGGNGNDDFYMSPGRETVEAGNDNDDIHGAAADLDEDTIDGGDGIDDLILTTAGVFALSMINVESVLLVNGTNNMTITSSSHDGGSDITCHIEGGSGADTITIDSHDLRFVGYTFENFVIETNGGIDIVTGGDGDDVIDGGAEGDALGGGAGDDILIGGAGADILSGGNGDDIYVDVDSGDLVNELLTTGTDTIETALAIYGMPVNIEILDYTGSADAELTGNSSSNEITAGSGADTVLGEDGNDTLKGLDQDDTLKGQAGDDVIYGGNGSDTVNGGSGNDTLYGGEHADTINGGANADTLVGGRGADTLNGDKGDDTLKGGRGADTLNGGAGNDTASYSGSGNRIDADLNRDVDQVIDGSTIEQLSSIENIIGGHRNDILAGDRRANILEGRDGADTLKGRDGADTLSGGDGDDILHPGRGDDIVDGGADHDTIDYSNVSTSMTALYILAGTFSINGTETGTDTVTGVEAIIAGSGDDTFNFISEAYGGAGNDTFRATDDADILDGGDDIDTVIYVDSVGYLDFVVDLENPASNTRMAAGDTLTAIENLVYDGNGNAVMYGNDSDNTFTTDGQLNSVIGRGGDDRVFADGFADILDGGAGVDTIDYSHATAGIIMTQLNHVLIGDGGAIGDGSINFEAITGSDLADTITITEVTADADGYTLAGEGGDDVLATGSGNDSIDGGDGADTIDGGDGADELTGGAGDDTFIYLTVDSSPPDDVDRDIITDFSLVAGNHDLIDLSAIDAQDSSGGTNEAFVFIGLGSYSGEGQVKVVQSGADTILHVNTSGNSGSEMKMLLLNVNAADLTAADFIL